MEKRRKYRIHLEKEVGHQKHFSKKIVNSAFISLGSFAIGSKVSSATVVHHKIRELLQFCKCFVLFKLSYMKVHRIINIFSLIYSK